MIFACRVSSRSSLRDLRIVGFDQPEVDVDQHLAVRVGEELADANAIGLVLDVGGLGLVVLVMNDLDVGQGFGTAADEEGPSAEQVAAGPMRFGIGVGQGEVAAANQAGDFLAVDGIRFGLAAVDGFHEQGMAEDERDPLLLHQVGQPVPVEGRFAADDEVFAEGPEGVQQQGCVLAREVLMEQLVSACVDHAGVQSLGMQVDPAVESMLSGIKFHHASPWVGNT